MSGVCMELAAWGKGELDKVVWACSAQDFEELQGPHPPGFLLRSDAPPPHCDTLSLPVTAEPSS